MRVLRVFLVLGASWLLLSLAHGDLATDLDDSISGVMEELGRAGKGVVRDDRLLVSAGLDLAAESMSGIDPGAPEVEDLFGSRAAKFRRAVAKCSTALEAARGVVDDESAPAARMGRSLRAVLRRGRQVQRALLLGAPPPVLVEMAGGGALRPGRTGILRVHPPDSAGSVSVQVFDEGPGATLDGPLQDLGGGRLRFRGGDGPGTARVVVSSDGGARTMRWVNLGGRRGLGSEIPWGGSGAAPISIEYAASTWNLRASTALHPVPPTLSGGEPEVFRVSPPLPAGLALDAITGAISGVPSSAAQSAPYTITASNPHGQASTVIDIEITPALPQGLLDLEDGFEAEVLLDGLSMPVKMALAPDGRLFFSELAGNVRVVGSDGVLRETPVAVLPVRTGGEQGLLGLAVAADFEQTPSLYVFATTEAGDGKPVRNRVLRLLLDGDVAVATEIVIDDLPAGSLHNGGDVQCTVDGLLFVSLGDTGTDALAQSDGSRAGRILRYTATGSVPADNPIADDPEWCRGLRNPFDMALHPQTGGLFATENGPTFGDELEFVLPGKNFEWPELPPEFPGALIGNRLREWTPVIVPTGIVFHPGTGFGAAYANNLFLAGYDVADLRRLVMSGTAFTDIDEERPFARWLSDGVDHRPLDLVVDGDGSLLVSTFSAIWRIRRF